MTISQNYDTTSSDPSDGDSESEVSENEMKEIKRRKTIELGSPRPVRVKSPDPTSPNSKRNLVTRSSVDIWQYSELDILQDELKSEFLSLAANVTSNELKHLKNSNSFSEEFTHGELDELRVHHKRPPSNLYRKKSDYKWSEPLIEKEKEEMRKQMLHLAAQNITNLSSLEKREE